MIKTWSTLGLMVCVLLASGVSHAGYTYVVDTRNASNGGSGSQFVTNYGNPPNTPPWPYLPSNADWGWIHNFAAQLPASWDDITRAQLTIRAWDVDSPGEDDVITLDGQMVGTLVGTNGQWSETTFDLLALGLESYLTDGAAVMWMDIDATPGGWIVAVDWARLEIDFFEEDPPPPPVIPAPAAIVLGSLGAGLVGWFRRRGTL